MLLNCPECELQVSDKTMVCPHCGYPMSKTIRPVKYNRGRKRLPNGFGRITELKNRNLRNSFRAMVSVGKDDVGKPIGKIVGYYKTYNDAYTALVEYNKNPYDLDTSITVEELYTKWSEWYFSTLASPTSARTIKSAWSKCTGIKYMKANEVRVRHIKATIEECESEHIRKRIKSMFNLMLDYAVEYEICERNYARDFQYSEKNKGVVEVTQAHITFTEEEMEILWNNLDVPYVNIILLQCYMGWRPQELGLILLKDVYLRKEKYIIGGMKTRAGKNRQVPIHPRILNIIQALYTEAMSLNSEYLINCTDTHTHNSSTKMTYDKYQYRYSNIIKQLGLNSDHKPHDPRKHFITQCKRSGVDEYAIKYMAGHAIDDITEKVYTERDISWLTSELNRVK